MTGGAILTAAQMRAAEQAAFDAGVDPHDLMEQAGAAAADRIYPLLDRTPTIIEKEKDNEKTYYLTNGKLKLLKNGKH